MKTRAAFGVAALLTVACNGRLPLPEPTLHGGDGFATVPYPPPVGRVEFVPPQTEKDAVWLDGSWVWRGRDWDWSAGHWQRPPFPQARYAGATTVRSPSGTLFFYPGRWYRADGEPLPSERKDAR
jgi:hypothetical protein